MASSEAETFFPTPSNDEINFISLSTGGMPSSPQNLTSGNFGRITSAGSPRILQLG